MKWRPDYRTFVSHMESRRFGPTTMSRRGMLRLASLAVAFQATQARAQQALPTVGFLSSRSPGESAGVVAAFRKGLAETGFAEGRNVAIAFRWAEGNYERLAALAAELVELKVAVIFAAGGPPSALAAKAATSASMTPVVFSAASDPVRIGLVKSYNQPGGNVTGMATLTTEMAGKVIEILKEMLPDVKAVAYLFNPSNPSGPLAVREAEKASGHLGVRVYPLGATTLTEVEGAFGELAKLQVKTLGVMGEPFFDSQRERIVALSAQHRIAGCYPWRDYVQSGGLMSYGTSLTDSYRQAATYVGRILNGESPSALPVMQPTKFEMSINLRTARQLGIVVPPTLIARADDVIE
jgi:putative ABC transport system substrate-binding protein